MKFLQHFYNSFLRIGWITSTISVVSGIVIFYVGNSSNKNFYMDVFVFFSIETILLFTALDAAFRSFQKAQNILPAVLRSAAPPNNAANFLGLIILEPSELFTFDQVVSVFFRDSDFEEFVGTGYVGNIQSDGKIQVFMLRIENNRQTDILERMRSNDRELHKKLLVRPSTRSNLFRQEGQRQ